MQIPTAIPGVVARGVLCPTDRELSGDLFRRSKEMFLGIGCYMGYTYIYDYILSNTIEYIYIYICVYHDSWFVKGDVI